MNEILHLPGPECARAHELLSKFVDGELAAEQLAWLSRHMELCAKCHADLAKFRAIDSELTGWGRQLAVRNPPPPDAREQLAASISPARRPWAIRLMLAAAAAMALAAIVIVMIPHQKPVVASREQSQFVGIPYLPPLDPRENAAIVRMNIRVSTLIAAGYKIAADPNGIIPADVLVGEDGRAHAVRLLGDIRLN